MKSETAKSNVLDFGDHTEKVNHYIYGNPWHLMITVTLVMTSISVKNNLNTVTIHSSLDDHYSTDNDDLYKLVQVVSSTASFWINHRQFRSI